MLAPFLGLPKQAEVLIIIFLGICFLSLDFSLFNVGSNLDEVWKLELNKTRYLETALKYIISGVVLIRTFTLHAFLACYVVMLWPAIFEEKPNLILPWLLLGMLRCLFLNAITFFVGTFICQKEMGLSGICFEFIIAQFIEHGPSIYAWMSILSFYRDLAAEEQSTQSSRESVLSESKQIEEADGENKEDDNACTAKNKSYSLGDLNLDYMQSSRFRRLSTDMPVDVLLQELRHVISKTRIIQDSSKSFESAHRGKNHEDDFEVFETLSSKDLTIIEKAMKILKITDQDVLEARLEKDKLIEILKEVKVQDVNEIDKKICSLSSPSFYIRRGKILKGMNTHIPKSVSHHVPAKSCDSCLCYLRRELQKDQSKLSLVECEIASIEFDVDDNEKPNCLAWENSTKEKCCQAKLKTNLQGTNTQNNDSQLIGNLTSNLMKNDIPNHLNGYRAGVGKKVSEYQTNSLSGIYPTRKSTTVNLIWKSCVVWGVRSRLTDDLATLRNQNLELLALYKKTK